MRAVRAAGAAGKAAQGGAAHLKLERVAGISPAAPAGECSPAAPWVTPSDLAAHAVRRCCQRGLSPPYPPHTGRRGARRAEAREAAFAPAGRLYPSQHGVPRCSRVPGGRAITHAPTRGTREGVTRPREARWLMARQSFGPFEAERMTADDEGDDSSRLLSRQGPDLQDGGASSETRDHIFASGGRKSGFVAASRAGRRTSLKGTARRRRHFAPLPFTTALPMVFAGREGVGSTAVPRGCCKRWLGAPISAAPGREPRRGSRCGGAIAARRRVGSRAAPSDPARQRPASVPDAAPTLPDASARWERRLAAFLRFKGSFKAARGVRELSRYLVGWREGGESPMCAPPCPTTLCVGRRLPYLKTAIKS